MELLDQADYSEGELERPLSVLVVDDEPSILISLKRLLAVCGYQVTVAAGGGQALAQLANNRYDLLLLDLAMPGIGGAAVLDAVIDRRLDMAVIVISGTSSVAEATATLRQGAIDYVRKPFGPEELLDSVARAAHKLRLERANRTMRLRLEASEQLHRFIVDNSPDLIFILDEEGRFTYLNQRVETLLGFETQALVGRYLVELIAPAYRDSAMTLLQRLSAEGREIQRAEWRLLQAGNLDNDHPALESLVIVEVIASAIFEKTGESPSFSGSHMVARDVTDRRQAEDALHRTSTRLQHVVSASPAVIYSRCPGVGMPVNFISSNVYEMLGYRAEEFLGGDCLLEDLMHPDDRSRFKQELSQEEGRVHSSYEYRLKHRDGSWRWIRDTVRLICDARNHPQELVGSWLDNTEAHILSEQLSYQASHDALTGLVNRRAFEMRLEQALHSAHEQNLEHALLYLDLDQFKIINDTCGHIAGDALLRQLSHVLQSRVRKQDTLARLGGDEFGILMERCALQNALRVANSLCTAVGDFRFAWVDKVFQVGASIGVVSIHAASDNLGNLLSAADSACYAAKDAGRNRVHLYTEDDVNLALRRGEMQWATRINQALEDNRFQLAFQPILPLSGSQAGHHYELLLRMKDEFGEIVLPGAFLPAAERYHLAVKLDHWVVRSALDWLSGNPEHLDDLCLCTINLSGHSLGDVPLLTYLLERLADQPSLTNKICFEVTETAVIANLGDALRFIYALKDIGCRFALDDFGSGLSSFAYLKKLPVDFIKIDGIFMEGIVNDPVSLALVNSINDIGHVMGMETIAEFVENERILAQLRAIGVNYGQGYLIGKPRPLAELAGRSSLEGY